MDWWDRDTEQDRPGRWHVRMLTPQGTVEFADIDSTSMDAAVDQAGQMFPDNFIEWAIWEPNRYGSWANGNAFNPGYFRTGREGI